jgi:hypothetical protein
VPYFAGPVADERDALLTFLAVPRAALRAAVFGLTDQQARSRPAAGALCLGGLDLNQETSRHAGHADIIREALDGRHGGQLLDAYEAG